MNNTGRIWPHYHAFQEARRVLAANFTSVAERKSAIDIRDEFMASAGVYVGELLDLLQDFRDATDGEECADPDSCSQAHSSMLQCSRCRIRDFVPERNNR